MFSTMNVHHVVEVKVTEARRVDYNDPISGDPCFLIERVVTIKTADGSKLGITCFMEKTNE